MPNKTSHTNPLPAPPPKLNDGSNPQSETGGALPVAGEWPLRSAKKYALRVKTPMNEDDQEKMLIYLIRALRDDRNPDVGGTDDAAMNLSAFDDPRAEQALLQVGREPDANETILDSCGASLAEIWIRKGDVSRAKLDSLSYAAKKSAERYILGVAPDRFPGAPESPKAEQDVAPNA